MIMHLLALVTLALPADELPGSHFARCTEELVLYVGPGAQHAGALTLPPGSVVRIEDSGAAFDRVFLAQGFAVYLHGSYVEVDEDTQTVTVSGNRVNARALPAVSSVRPVGQVSSESGALTLLGREGDWLRVVAPPGLPLYAAQESLVVIEDAAGRGAWTQQLQARAQQHARRLAFWRATDPRWLRTAQDSERVVELERIKVAQLSATQLEDLSGRADKLLMDLSEPALRTRVDAVSRSVREVQLGRRAEKNALVALEAQQARELANLAREARYLGFGLRFEGQGDALQVEGKIHRRTADDRDVAVYTVKDVLSGREFKLTAAREIAALPPLLGKRVVLSGREMKLVNVNGAVLVVDDVVRIVE